MFILPFKLILVILSLFEFQHNLMQNLEWSNMNLLDILAVWIWSCWDTVDLMLKVTTINTFDLLNLDSGCSPAT